jgi:hypothetical protein
LEKRLGRKLGEDEFTRSFGRQELKGKTKQPKHRHLRPEELQAIAATAHHEAGHAVIAHAQGRKLTSVSIIGLHQALGEKQRGLTHASSSTVHDAIEEAIVTCAGPAAEFEYLRAQGLHKGSSSLSQWLKVQMKAAVDANLNGDYRHLSKLPLPCDTMEIFRFTAYYVDHYWLQIKAVAAALFKERKLSGRTVRKIISACRPRLKRKTWG